MASHSAPIAIADAAAAVTRASRHARAAATAAAAMAVTDDSDLRTPEQAAYAKEAQADAHIRAQDLDAALQCLDKAIFLQPTRAMLYAKRAQVYWELCDLKSAMASYRKLFSIDANPPQRIKDQFAMLLDLHGYSLLEVNEMPAIAISYLTEAIQLNGLDESYWLHRAIAYIRAGCFDRALKDVDHCICLNRSDVEYFVLRAKLHWRLHMHDRATSDIHRAAQLAPLHPEVVEHEQRLLRESQAIYDDACRHAIQREFADAIACLNKAADISPDDARFYLLRAAAHRELGEYHVALKDSDRALALHRRHMETAAAKQQQQEQVEGSSSTTQPPILSEMGGAADRSRAYHEIASQRNLILADIGRTFLRDKSYQLALNALNQAIRGDSELAALFYESQVNYELLVHRGDAYRGLDNFQAALGDYHRALELVPESVDIHARVAVIHYQFGIQLFNKAQFERAELEFATAITQDPSIAVYYVRRGDAARYLEKHEAACVDYQRALQLEPRDQDTKNKLKQYGVQPFVAPAFTPAPKTPARYTSNQHTSIERMPSPVRSPIALVTAVDTATTTNSSSSSALRGPRQRSDAASRLDDARRACATKNRAVQELFLNRPVMAKKPQ